MKANADVIFWRDLKASRPYMTKQQYRTIKGCGSPVETSAKQKHRPRRQPRTAVKGQVNDARKGLQKILMRRGSR